ncbi:MAG: cation:proton antiporter [Candidatus Aenigmarchaeota archaeon]|nr:cation:proton antiporter [Candidatus Aenigmarchaeota archaeon]
MGAEIFLSIALLLITAKIFGWIAEKAGFSSLVGELFAGIMLGPVFALVSPEPFLAQIANLGVIFLLFLIGLSTKVDEFREHVYIGSILAAGGAFVSFFLGFGVGYLIFGSIQAGIFLGIAIISTSTAISIRTLVEAGEFHSSIGRILLTTGVADDIIAILALAILSTFVSFGGVQVFEIFTLFLAIVGFMLLMLTAGSKAVSWFLAKLQRIKDEQVLIAFPLTILFGIAFLSEQIGIAAVTGAFLAGVAMSKSPITETAIIPKAKTIGYGLFIPIFFAYSSIMLDLGAFFNSYPLIIALVVVGLLAKFIGCGLLARFMSLNAREQKIMGIGMMPRGEYSIVIAQIMLTAGVIAAPFYTVIISFVVLSIVIPPMLFKMAIRDVPVATNKYHLPLPQLPVRIHAERVRKARKYDFGG